MKSDIDRIKEFISYAKKSKNAIGKEIGDKNGMRLTHVESGRNKISEKLAKDITDVYDKLSYNWLLTGEGEMLSDMNTALKPIAKNDAAIEVPTNYIKVPVIPIKAQAGLLTGYGDDAYWDGLPTEIWEVDREYKGNYVVFEIRGDSMDDNTVEAILEGDRVLCREIGKQHWQNKLHINKWNFVIVHKEEGIIVKRITDHEVEAGIIKCHSLNSYYEDFEINLKDVIALYNVVDLKRNLRL